MRFEVGSTKADAFLDVPEWPDVLVAEAVLLIEWTFQTALIQSQVAPGLSPLRGALCWYNVQVNVVLLVHAKVAVAHEIQGVDTPEK